MLPKAKLKEIYVLFYQEMYRYFDYYFFSMTLSVLDNKEIG